MIDYKFVDSVFDLDQICGAIFTLDARKASYPVALLAHFTYTGAIPYLLKKLTRRSSGTNFGAPSNPAA